MPGAVTVMVIDKERLMKVTLSYGSYLMPKYDFASNPKSQLIIIYLFIYLFLICHHILPHCVVYVTPAVNSISFFMFYYLASVTSACFIFEGMIPNLSFH